MAKKSKVLCQEIFTLITSGKFGKDYDYALIDQINSSSGSIMENIADGFGRMGNREFVNFLTYSTAQLLNVNRKFIGLLIEIILVKKNGRANIHSRGNKEKNKFFNHLS